MFRQLVQVYEELEALNKTHLSLLICSGGCHCIVSWLLGKKGSRCSAINSKEWSNGWFAKWELKKWEIVDIDEIEAQSKHDGPESANNFATAPQPREKVRRRMLARQKCSTI